MTNKNKTTNEARKRFKNMVIQNRRKMAMHHGIRGSVSTESLDFANPSAVVRKAFCPGNGSSGMVALLNLMCPATEISVPEISSLYWNQFVTLTNPGAISLHYLIIEGDSAVTFSGVSTSATMDDIDLCIANWINTGKYKIQHYFPVIRPRVDGNGAWFGSVRLDLTKWARKVCAQLDSTRPTVELKNWWLIMIACGVSARNYGSTSESWHEVVYSNKPK